MLPLATEAVWSKEQVTIYRPELQLHALPCGGTLLQNTNVHPSAPQNLCNTEQGSHLS